MSCAAKVFLFSCAALHRKVWNCIHWNFMQRLIFAWYTNSVVALFTWQIQTEVQSKHTKSSNLNNLEAFSPPPRCLMFGCFLCFQGRRGFRPLFESVSAWGVSGEVLYLCAFLSRGLRNTLFHPEAPGPMSDLKVT